MPAASSSYESSSHHHTLATIASVAVRSRGDRQLPNGQNVALAQVIRERIVARLGAKIHDLQVKVHQKVVVLEGRCATYYSKQLAQHAALGAMEDEQLDNRIVVAVPS